MVELGANRATPPEGDGPIPEEVEIFGDQLLKEAMLQ